jgi:hypothetical protein
MHLFSIFANKLLFLAAWWEPTLCIPKVRTLSGMPCKRCASRLRIPAGAAELSLAVSPVQCPRYSTASCMEMS